MIRMTGDPSLAFRHEEAVEHKLQVLERAAHRKSNAIMEPNRHRNLRKNRRSACFKIGASALH
jgi:plasmid maintenance system killer protein